MFPSEWKRFSNLSINSHPFKNTVYDQQTLQRESERDCLITCSYIKLNTGWTYKGNVMWTGILWSQPRNQRGHYAEREREREREGGRGFCLCVCLYDAEKERGTEREREKESWSHFMKSFVIQIYFWRHYRVFCKNSHLAVATHFVLKAWSKPSKCKQ